MKNSEQNHIIFSEIINSHSIEFSEKLGELYIRHQTHLESLVVEKQYIHFLTKAREQNIPSNSERERLIISENLWSKKEEDDLSNTKIFIQGLGDNISREYLHSRRKIWRKEIYDAEKRLDALLMKKDYLIGSTAEKYAHEQSFHYQVINSFYRDSGLNEKVQIDDTSNDEYGELVKIYNRYQERMLNDNIKRIAVSPFFTNLFHMCGDNAYYFYGKSIVSLTSHQTNLFMWGRYFKSLMGQYGDKLPKSMSDDADDMMEFFEISQNAEKSGILKEDEASDGGMMSLPGANKKDMEMLGIDTSRVVNMSKEIAKHGGHINKDELYKLNG